MNIFPFEKALLECFAENRKLRRSVELLSFALLAAALGEILLAVVILWVAQ